MGNEVYIILYTAVDTDRAKFPEPEALGTYLDLNQAMREMERQIKREKAALDGRFDHEERGDSFWEMSQSGYDAACFTRFDLLRSRLHNGVQR